MKKARIRPLAICVFQHNGHILVAEGFDAIKEQSFYRPLGGGIEFGERGRDTVTRELREELGVEVTNVRYLGTLENIFTYEGRPGHEIVLIYDGSFVDQSLYHMSVLHGSEDDGSTMTAIWMPLAGFTEDRPPLYPEGLTALLQEQPPQHVNQT